MFTGRTPGGTVFTGGTPGGTVFTGGTEASMPSSQLHSFPSDHQVALCRPVECKVMGESDPAFK